MSRAWADGLTAVWKSWRTWVVLEGRGTLSTMPSACVCVMVCVNARDECVVSVWMSVMKVCVELVESVIETSGHSTTTLVDLWLMLVETTRITLMQHKSKERPGSVQTLNQTYAQQIRQHSPSHGEGWVASCPLSSTEAAQHTPTPHPQQHTQGMRCALLHVGGGCDDCDGGAVVGLIGHVCGWWVLVGLKGLLAVCCAEGRGCCLLLAAAAVPAVAVEQCEEARETVHSQTAGIESAAAEQYEAVSSQMAVVWYDLSTARGEAARLLR